MIQNTHNTHSWGLTYICIDILTIICNAAHNRTSKIRRTGDDGTKARASFLSLSYAYHTPTYLAISPTIMPIRHVFVFRHCVRSTEAELHVLDADPSAYPSNPASYLAVPLPTWGTAPMWCTRVGAEILQATGQYLIDSYLPQFGTTTTSKLRVEWITDTDQRDVDTSLHLAEGMARAVQQNPDMAQIQGLKNLQYDPGLFHPTSPTWDSNQPVCQNVTRETRNTYVTERLGTVPKPSADIQKVLDLIQKYGGTGSVGSLSNLPSTFVNSNHSELGGQITPVDYFAESAFYAKASEIDFFENMTKPELMELVSWHYWKRSVVSVGNNYDAMLGGFLMDRVLRSLAGIGQPTAAADVDNVDQTATFYIGHDGNLDQIATALNFRWVLPPPYPSGKDGIWTPTPPNAGLHFMYDPDSQDQRVHFSILTPMYFNDDGSDELVLNKTGILEERPVLFENAANDPTIHVGPRSTSIGAGSGSSSSNAEKKHVLDVLRDRLEKRLQTFPGAMECYQKGQAIGPTPVPVATAPTAAPSVSRAPTTGSYHPPTNPQTDFPTNTHDRPPKSPGPPKKKSSAKGEVFSVWMAFIFMSAILICLVRSVRRQRRRGPGGGGGGRRGASYTEMGDAQHELSFEMT